MTLNRRTLITHGVALTGCAAVSPLLGQPTPATLMSQALADAATERRKPFLFAVVFDPHVIDRFYLPGRENGVEDDESILHANERLLQARTSVNTFRQADGRRVAGVIPGDCFHNDPSADYSFYQENETRIDLFRKAIDGFHAPVHLGFGNHDYDVPRISREMSHRLFLEKLKSDPYSAVNDRDFRFLQVNNFLGKTWDATSSDFNKGIGSLGETQLLWLEPQLAARRPTTVLVHYPLFLIQATEVGGLGLHPLLRRYADSIQVVISGPLHKWVDFAHTYGPQHMVLAATRYDPNSWMLWEADPASGTVRWLDRNRVEWSTHYASPYPSAT